MRLSPRALIIDTRVEKSRSDCWLLRLEVLPRRFLLLLLESCDRLSVAMDEAEDEFPLHPLKACSKVDTILVKAPSRPLKKDQAEDEEEDEEDSG